MLELPLFVHKYLMLYTQIIEEIISAETTIESKQLKINDSNSLNMKKKIY